MTCNNCLQEILQGESFFEDEDNGTAYHADCRQAAVDRRNRAEDERAAALARAEAAEALAYQRLEDALFAEQRATDADIRAEETDADASRLRLELATAKLGISALAARVAELESQLAAQSWRPVTEEWPPCNRHVVISAPGASWADVARKQHDGEEYVWQLKNGHVLDFESATVATPLPPAPAPQEATP